MVWKFRSLRTLNENNGERKGKRGNFVKGWSIGTVKDKIIKGWTRKKWLVRKVSIKPTVKVKEHKLQKVLEMKLFKWNRNPRAKLKPFSIIILINNCRKKTFSRITFLYMVHVFLLPCHLIADNYGWRDTLWMVVEN